MRSLLAKPEVSVVVNLLAIDPQERPRFLAKFLPEIAKLRSTDRPPALDRLDEAPLPAYRVGSGSPSLCLRNFPPQ